MNIRDAVNRGFNLLGVSIVALSGFAFAPEMFLENDVPDKLDDALLFIVGLIGIAWYTKAKNKYTRSIVPVGLVGVALLLKIMAVIVEFNDVENVGDDFGGLILFVLSFGLILYQYFKTKKLLAASA
jgi:hypothetical protein